MLLGKYEMREAAQYGLQRFSAKRVVPVAPRAFHVVQWFFVRAALASAHEMTKLLGFVSVAPEHARILIAGDLTGETPALAGAARAGTAREPARAMGRAIRARRGMMTTFIVWIDISGDYVDSRTSASGSDATFHLDTPGVHAKLKVLRDDPWS